MRGRVSVEPSGMGYLESLPVDERVGGGLFLCAGERLERVMGDGLTSVGWPEVGNVTATAVLGWYAWHTATKTIPSLIENFREEMAASRYELREEREAMREELAAERRERHVDNTAIVEALRDLGERLPRER